MKKWEEAEKDYLAGMKYKDIATKYDVSVNTVKSWRSRHGWARGAPSKKSVHPKSKKVAPKIVDELEANGELNDKQKLFCLFYLQQFNATWAYQRVYKCSYETARVEGSRTLANPNIKKQITELKKQQRSELLVTIDDIAHEYAKQAFASLGDVLDYKVHEELVTDTDGNVFLDTDDNPVKKHVADIYLKPSDQIDWSLVQDIHRGKDGLVVKLYDKQKALDSLMKYFKDDENMSKAKLRKTNAEAKIAEIKAHDAGVSDENQMNAIGSLLDKIQEGVVKDDDQA